LTTAGDEFLPTARRLLHEFDSSIKEMRALGKLGVGAVPSVMALLPSEASASFIDKYPGIDLYLREDNSAAVQQRILSGDVDSGICSPWEPDNQLSFDPLFKDTYGVVTAPEHPLATREGDITWEDLQSYRIVGFSADLGMQHQLTQTSALSQDFREPRYRVSNTSTIATLLARGVGVSAMSALAAQRAPLDDLNFRPSKDPTLARIVGLLTRAGRSLSPAATAMIAEVRRALPALTRFNGIRVLSPTGPAMESRNIAAGMHGEARQPEVEEPSDGLDCALERQYSMK